MLRFLLWFLCPCTLQQLANSISHRGKNLHVDIDMASISDSSTRNRLRAALETAPPIQVSHKDRKLTLTPFLLEVPPDNNGESTRETHEDELTESVVSLYRHVLPSLGKRFLRKMLAQSNASTVVLFRDEDGQHSCCISILVKSWPHDNDFHPFFKTGNRGSGRD